MLVNWWCVGWTKCYKSTCWLMTGVRDKLLHAFLLIDGLLDGQSVPSLLVDWWLVWGTKCYKPSCWLMACWMDKVFQAYLLIDDWCERQNVTSYKHICWLMTGVKDKMLQAFLLIDGLLDGQSVPSLLVDWWQNLTCQCLLTNGLWDWQMLQVRSLLAYLLIDDLFE